MSKQLIDRSKAGILLIDAQPAFIETMDGPLEPVLVRLEQLMLYASALDVPLIATFEHPVEEKGMLPERLEPSFPPHGKRFTKRAYDCCANRKIREAIKELPLKQVVVAGAETDVCVLQSVLGLLRMKYKVFLLEDCIFSSEPKTGAALNRMLRAGAVPCTLKMLYYELTRSVDFIPSRIEDGLVPPAFKERFIHPEKLPPRNP